MSNKPVQVHYFQLWTSIRKRCSWEMSRLQAPKISKEGGFFKPIWVFSRPMCVQEKIQMKTWYPRSRCDKRVSVVRKNIRDSNEHNPGACQIPYRYQRNLGTHKRQLICEAFKVFASSSIILLLIDPLPLRLVIPAGLLEACYTNNSMSKTLIRRSCKQRECSRKFQTE